jgi:hypothetical protein
MAQVNYDQSAKILAQPQPTEESCATTCAAMCVMKTTGQLAIDGFKLDNTDWSGIAAKYGYKLIPGSTSLSFKDIINGLKGSGNILVCL